MKLLVPLFIGIILCTTGNAEESRDPYQYHLVEVDHAVAGTVSINSARGERVRAVLEELVAEAEHGEEAGPKYLQLHYKPNVMASKAPSSLDIVMTTEKRPDLLSQTPTAQKLTGGPSTLKPAEDQPEADMDDSSDSSNIRQSEHEHRPPQQLVGNHHPHHSIHITHHVPGGHAVNIHKRDVHSDHLWYNTAESSAFYVDPVDNYIKVNDKEEFADHKSIEFYVYLTNDHGEVVSNPLPFTIHIERPVESDSYPLGPAVFAGVLVLVIVFLALFIPFVTRAKRRYKQGKPVFKLGSHPSTVDLDRGSMSRASSEPNWYGNNAYYSYEDEVAKERKDFSSGIKLYTNDTPTVQVTKKTKETLSVASGSGSSGIDLASQYAEGTIADETMSQRM